MPGFEVPQFEGADGAGSPTGEPEPAAGFVGVGVQSEKQLECPSQFRRGCCISPSQPDSWLMAMVSCLFATVMAVCTGTERSPRVRATSRGDSVKLK